MKKRVRKAAEESLERLRKSEVHVNGMRNITHVLVREQVVTAAKATRFWSVWREVFADDPDMLERFQKAKGST